MTVGITCWDTISDLIFLDVDLDEQSPDEDEQVPDQVVNIGKRNPQGMDNGK